MSTPGDQYVIRLDDEGSSAIDTGLVGGKAAALARLVRAGHPVPHGFVLTTAAYRDVAATDPIRALRQRLTKGPNGDDVDDGDHGDDSEIDRVFDRTELPQPIRAAIDMITRSCEGALVVRSSASEEDQASSAFAGQYRSISDVEPTNLESAVRRVWSSLWHGAPREYRLRSGRSAGEPAMAVIVMEMVPAEIGGVLFTRDPVGVADDVRIDLVAGTAEQLVAGWADPADFVWSRRTAAASAAARLGPAVAEVVDRSLAIELDWATPVDVEFAIDRAGRPWIVQARPITTGRAWSEREPTSTWVSIDEMLPGDLPLLLQRTAGRHVEEGLRWLFDELDVQASSIGATDRPFIEFDEARASLDVDLVRRAVTSAGSSGQRTNGLIGRLAEFRRVTALRRMAMIESEVVVQAVDDLVASPPAVPDHTPLVDLIAVWERVQDLGARVTAAEIAVAAVAVAAHDGVRSTLERRQDSGQAAEVARLLTTPMNGAGPLDRCMRTSDVFAEFLGRSGSRLVFGGPTWADEPELARLVASPLSPRRRALPDLPDGWSRSRRRLIRREAADAAALLARRERTKSALLDLGGIAHRLTVRIGDELAAAQVIGEPTDIWWLTPSELRAACISATAPEGLALRRPETTARPDPMPTQAGARARTHWPRTGRPASPGRATGRAVIVDGRASVGAVAQGDIIVAAHSDPGWTPLLRSASGIAVETGSALSHAAILAREFAIPAVVGVVGIVDAVRTVVERTGRPAEVEIDGTTGRVAVRATRADPIPAIVPTVTVPDDEPRLGVFVTGLIGAGAVFLAVTSATESVSSHRAVTRTERRAGAPARATAAFVRTGPSASLRSSATTIDIPDAAKLRLRASTVTIGALAFAAAALRAYVSGEEARRVWWSVSAMTACVGAGVAAIVGFRSASRWPDVDPIVRRLADFVRTASGVAWSDLPRRHRRTITTCATIAIVLIVAVVLTPGWLGPMDEWLYEAIGAPASGPWGPPWFDDVFGRPGIVIPAAALMMLLTIRCRVLTVAFASTIVFGGLANMGLGSLIGRPRPLLGEHPGRTDSFPSGHAVEVTLLLGLLPLAVAVATRSNRVGLIVRVVSTAALAVMLIDGLRDGSHWPIDHLGGSVIALCAVVTVHALAITPKAHASCSDCPTSVLRGRR